MTTINYPEPENQGSRKEQLDASVKAVIISVVILGAFAVGALLWNNRNAILNFF
jgi:hypothetical protein